MKCGFLTAAAFMFLLGGYALGRAQRVEGHTIDLGPVTLRLGMSRDSAITALSPYYHVSDLGMVTTKSGPPYESVGQVIFKDGKVSNVWKDWALKNQEHGYELANNLYGILDGLKREGKTACTLNTRANQEPSIEIKTILLYCGEKAVRVDAEQFRKQEQTEQAAVVNEILGIDSIH